MTLREVINAIELTAAEQPSVRQIVREDVFRINALTNRKYGIFAWLQGQHSATVANGFVSYNFTLFYVDRLTGSKANAVDVQSAGMQTIDNVIRTLDEAGLPAESYTIQPFTQRFTDECAGVFAVVSFSVPVNSLCPEIFKDVADGYLLDADGLYILTSNGERIQVI